MEYILYYTFIYNVRDSDFNGLLLKPIVKIIDKKRYYYG